ncbi:C40 family peptidase [Sporosarcina cyprini]|uniref:C40 family peptidase n=1 Tax=Sporosarcina cyprini TaxID=2910523 RepID=UPI001EDD2EC8|nr:C40 family peptidase [Sporosarcina cyprini]MCG3088110.1 NlpC/P60 family protein [Sporosarcina cyprini]
MKKVALSVLLAGSLAFGLAANDAEASTHKVKQGESLWTISQSTNVSIANLKKWNNLKSDQIKPNQVLVTSKQSTSASATKTGTYKTKHNVNIRSGAGTNHKIVTLAKQGTSVKVIGEKKVGKEVWYKVSVNGKNGWALSTLLTKGTVAKKSASSNVAFSDRVIDQAMSLRGIPYRFGGTTVNGFDCSGFVQYAFKKSGKMVPRDTLGQFAASTKVSNPKPGDLVFFQNTYRKGISHVGIYLGNNKFIHAGGKKSQVTSLSDRYWKSKFHSFKRL